MARQVPSERALPMPFLFGLIGLSNLILFLPFIAILQVLSDCDSACDVDVLPFTRGFALGQLAVSSN